MERQDGTGRSGRQSQAGANGQAAHGLLLVWELFASHTRGPVYHAPLRTISAPPTRPLFSPCSPSITLAAHRTHSSRRMVQCHFDVVIAHEKAIIPYPTPPLVQAPSRLLLSTAQNLPNDFAAALFFDTRRTLKRTVFDSGRH